MESDRPVEGENKRIQPTYRQMGRYALCGVALTLLATPLLYIRWMKRSPLPWLSPESFEHFGTFVLVLAVVFVLVLIGSHGDPDDEA